MKGRSSYLLLLVFLVACKQTNKPTLFSLETNTGIAFTNTVTNTPDFNIFSYRNFYNGGGVAIGDINNDGLADVFLTSNMGANKLYLNKGNFTFEDISDKAGITQLGKWNTGVVMADVNADGWLDIYVCNAGYDKFKNKDGNALFINNHNLTFTDKAAVVGLNDGGYTTHAAFFDYDLDGDLDCYILNNSFIPVNTLNYSNKRTLRANDWPIEDFAKGGGDKLMRNDNGIFKDVSDSANIYGSLIGFGLGVTVADVNGDHYPDLYISNDFFERDYLYINQQNGTFKEDLENRMQHTSLASMGADVADINNDGAPDIFTTDMLPGDEQRLKTTASFDNYDIYQYKVKQGFYHQFQQNALQINDGKGNFKETANYSGVSATDWSWGALIFDADNDGLQDLYVCNGIYKDVIDQDFIDFFADDLYQKMALSGQKTDMQQIVDKMPSVPILNKAFKNKGGLQFSDEGINWGFTTPSFSNGAAYGDLDNDGDLDLVINNVNMPSFVYKNHAQENAATHYISIQLKGASPNTFAIGSTVKVFTGNNIYCRDVYPARGFQSSTDYKMVVGLGNGMVDSIQVIWPNNMQSTIVKPTINTLLTIDYNIVAKQVFKSATNSNNPIIFQAANQNFDAHKENDFTEFYQDRNVPVMLSKEGPQAAVADVNSDGLDDVFIGGAAGTTGNLYVQTVAGTFNKASVACFEKDKAFEDVATLFFDADNDGDKDLIVGSGGNNLPPHHPLLQLRLYTNDGKGNFVKSTETFTDNNANISTIVAHDIDNDGDLDLFVGGRSLSYNYGAAPQSYIFTNNGKGHFIDDTKRLAPAISNIGMVTSATWADVVGDKNKELIIVGEWMTPQIFEYKNDKLSLVTTNLNNYFGWWQTVTTTDVNGDGKLDLLLGNIGENAYLKPTQEAPIKLWMNDFDNNGIIDKVFSRTVNGADVPLFLKKEFTEILPIYKKENLLHKDFATKSIQDIFKKELLDKATVLQFNTCGSYVAINNGNGNFTLQLMPTDVQLSSANSILPIDVDNDGINEIVVAGNNTNFLPQFGRLDANSGVVLKVKPDHTLVVMQQQYTGLNIQGVVKCIEPITIKQSKAILFTRNNNYPLLFSFKAQ